MHHSVTLLIQTEFELEAGLTGAKEEGAMHEHLETCVKFFELHGYNVSVESSELVESEDKDEDAEGSVEEE